MRLEWSVDPGAQGCYCVRWSARDGRIVEAVYTDEPIRSPEGLLVCEAMQVRNGRYSDDLLAVSRMSGRVCALGPVKYVTPAQWKGQVPKEVHQRTRILPTLAPEELEILERACGRRKSLLHNYIDAAGIGLWYLKRGVQ